jgi:death-on-curing protein
MQTPVFLTVEEVLQIHEDQIANYGGSPGLRDLGLLESAVDAPGAAFGGGFFYNDPFEMAAALLFALVKNHAFVDGNKRVGAAAALVFLSLNGIGIREDEPALSDLVLAVASGGAERNSVARYLRAHAE